MPRPADSQFTEHRGSFNPAATQVRRRRLEALRDQEHAAEIRAFHQAEVDRTRRQPVWRLPKPGDGAA